LLTRNEALSLVKKHVSKRNVVYHMLAVEAIMRSVAKHGAERDRILVCEEIEIPREKFFEIALNGLKSVASEIGL